ncbi:hypothetical protein QYM36_012243 [Artemia franciscana]|uniref:Uncharacterized protein n=1 Tax=Artemia franciscana TaxID=6661 RepID=A0AA88HKE4_ARTSF|nr:hypothetical protein QYM36_012243 [Artemia franciscana]
MTDFDEEEDFVLSDASSDESLHIGDIDEDDKAFLRPEGTEEGDFVCVKVLGKRITSYFVAKVLVKDKIKDEIEVLFSERIFPLPKETTEKGRSDETAKAYPVWRNGKAGVTTHIWS